MTPKKLAIVFGDVTLTFTPEDVEAVLKEWEAENPSKSARDIPEDEFAGRCVERLARRALEPKP